MSTQRTPPRSGHTGFYSLSQLPLAFGLAGFSDVGAA